MTLKDNNPGRVQLKRKNCKEKQIGSRSTEKQKEGRHGKERKGTLKNKIKKRSKKKTTEKQKEEEQQTRKREKEKKKKKKKKLFVSSIYPHVFSDLSHLFLFYAYESVFFKLADFRIERVLDFYPQAS